MSITAAMVKALRDRTDAPMMACKKALQETNGDIEAAVEVLRKAGEANAAKRASKTAAEGKVVIAQADGQLAFIAEINSQTDFAARDSNFVAYSDLVAQQGLAGKAQDVDSLMTMTTADGQTLEDVRQELINKIGENIKVRRVALLNSDGVVGSYAHGDRIAVLVALDKDDAALARDVAMHIAASNPQAIAADDVPADLVASERAIFEAQAQQSGKPKEIMDKMVTGRVNKFLKEISLLGQPFVKNPDQSVGDLLKQHGATVTAFVRFEVGEGIEKETQNFADEVMAQVQGK